MAHKYEILVGNIGTVERTNNAMVANAAFNRYVKVSKSAHGRASGEPVTMLTDGEITREYAPVQSENDHGNN